MNIQTIIKRAIKRLELEGKLLTPDFYMQAFCAEAKKAGARVEDCSHVDKYVKSLNEEFQKDLSQYRIRTIHELVRFLVSKLNRSDLSQYSKDLDAQSLFLKRVLQVVEILHNKEASTLAKKSLDLLGTNPSVSELEQFKQLWINFSNAYDDTFLDKLKVFGEVNHKDLQKTIQYLDLSAKDSDCSDEVKKFSKIASLLVLSFTPSVAFSANDKIAKFAQRIKSNPSILLKDDIEKEIKTVISLRIALDKKSVKDMLISLDGVLDKLSLRLIDIIEKSDVSTQEIKKIKAELEGYTEESSQNFKTAHKKLLTIAMALEENTELLSKEVKSHSNDVKILSKKIYELEEELYEAKKESKEDYLTKVYNRRALDEELNIKEEAYKRHNHNYALVMFDLDKFKLVNDNYGHEAGDSVLVAFANILKQESRTIDIVGRYGGEEFLVLLCETDKKGATVFAEKVRKHVKKSKFMYKDVRIELTVSVGVVQRNECISLQNTIENADKRLYIAKNSGRDKVVSESK